MADLRGALELLVREPGILAAKWKRPDLTSCAGSTWGESGTSSITACDATRWKSWLFGTSAAAAHPQFEHVVDDFRALAPNGDPVSSYVTLRTFSEVTSRWEMVGLQALQASAPAEWHGLPKDGEMLLDAMSTLPNGQRVHTKIRFFEIASDSFSWQSSMSLDDGKIWRKTALLKATRRADA